MRSIIQAFILFFLFQICYSQSPGDNHDPIIDSLKRAIENEIINLRLGLENKDYLSDLDKQVTIDFQCDTFRVERLLSKRIDIDYTTYGMIQAINDAETEYDKLLNKYYQLLMKKLNDSDKEILRQTQRNWIQFRDSERRLNIEISKEEYSGGGTIQQLIIASEYLAITKNRVLELYGYLTRLDY